MVLRIDLKSQEDRQCADGDAVWPKDNKPWQKVMEEKYGTSILEGKDALPVEVIDSIRRKVTAEVKAAFVWSFKMDRSAYDVMIDDIVKDEKGILAAIYRWKSAYQRSSGHGGHGSRWVESRMAVGISVDAANEFQGKFDAKVHEILAEQESRMSFERALQMVELDDQSVNEKRLECLKAAGLDDESIQSRREKLKKEWEASRAKSTQE